MNNSNNKPHAENDESRARNGGLVGGVGRARREELVLVIGVAFLDVAGQGDHSTVQSSFVTSAIGSGDDELELTRYHEAKPVWIGWESEHVGGNVGYLVDYGCRQIDLLERRHDT